MSTESSDIDRTWPMIVYALYLASLVAGITAIIGLIIAYVNWSDPDERLQAHYRFQIRTFWIGLMYTVIGTITIPILIGWLVLIWAVVWFIIRCVKGMVALNEGRAHPDPGSWLFG